MKSEFNSESIAIRWGGHLELPPKDEHGKKNPGLAGVFAGYISDYYVVAGGANFADKPLAEGGAKQWWSDIYVHDGKQWNVYKDALPYPVGYGYSVELPQGLLCIGGCNKDECSDLVYMIKIQEDGSPVIKNLPSMPYPLANMSGGMIDDKVYLAGGILKTDNQQASKTFICLDLNTYEWSELPSWNGAARAFSVSAVQNDSEEACFYLFSGRDFGSGKNTEILYDGWKYSPSRMQWTEVEGYYPVMAGTAIPVGTDKILFFGGRCETGADDNVIRTFNTITGNIQEEAVSEVTIPVTCITTYRGSEFTIASGETAPGIRTPVLARGTILKSNTNH